MSKLSLSHFIKQPGQTGQPEPPGQPEQLGLPGRYRHLMALAGVIIIALFLRTYQLQQFPPGLYPDEAMNGNNALEAIRTGEYKVFYPENNGREGLFINIQALFIRAFGLREPWVLRLPSTIFGTLTVLGIYFLARELFGRQVGLLAAFLLATSFWHLIFSRIGFRAITAPFYGTWGLWLLLVALRTKRFSRSLVLSLLAGVVLGLGFHSYIAYRVMPILALLLFFLCWFYRREEPNLIPRLRAAGGLFFLGFTIAVAPLAIHFIQTPKDFFSRTTQLSVFASQRPIRDLRRNVNKTLGMFQFGGDRNWRHNYSRRPQLFWPVGIFFFAGLILVVYRLRRHRTVAGAGDTEPIAMGSTVATDSRVTTDSATSAAPAVNTATPDRRDRWQLLRRLRAAARRSVREDTAGYPLCLAWLVIATAPVMISNEGIPHALRGILMIPPVMILSACGGMFLYRAIREELRERKGLRWCRFWRAGAVALLALLLIEAAVTYFYRWGPNPNTRDAFTQEYVTLGRKLLSLPPEVKKYVVVCARGMNVRDGFPTATQTTMFITDTFLPEQQREKNIYYVLPDKITTIPPDAQIFILEDPLL